MTVHFDTNAEEEKIRQFREREAEDLAEILAPKYGVEYTDLTLVPVDMEALALISKQQAEEARIIVFARGRAHVSIGAVRPLDEKVQNIVRAFKEKNMEVKLFLISERSFHHAFSRYADIVSSSAQVRGEFEIQPGKDEASSLLRVKEELDSLISKKSVATTDIIDVITSAALSLSASDVHIEPEEEGVRLRFRLDGLLIDVYSFPSSLYRPLNSRVKLLSGMKINITARAQDGRFTLKKSGSEIEVRSSAIPGAYGESLVLRILDPKAIKKTYGDLGIGEKLLTRLEKEVRRANGTLLVTGPTGSGKTTTLYTFLQHLHTPETKIITIEDPIEYHLPGIVQTQTDGKEYTFASGLRSVLRQDPDIILVGEIRDEEVAQTAIQAALTGHFVFSTLHTNTAAGAFPRLVDLGVDPKLFASAITVSMAQRLVRTLNQKTKRARQTTQEEKEMMMRILETLTDTSLMPTSFDTVYEATPGEHGETGYKGREGLYEAIFMDEELGQFLRDNPSEGEIAKSVLRQGYPTIAQDGILKVLAGKTTLEEVSRVVNI